jgi:nucleoside phosphorylase/5'-deoxynucleotidase YfbR-like HD superfamily hydrolase
MPKNRVDCGIIIALREEFVGAKTFHGFEEFFEVERQHEPGPFQHFNFSDAQGVARTGVVAVMENMSPLAAYESSRDLLDAYQPTLLINVGIAGALADWLKVGDVVVANEIDSYDYRAKAVPSDSRAARDFTFNWGGRHSNPSEDVAGALSRLWQIHALYDQWTRQCQDRLKAGVSDQMLQSLLSKGFLNREQRLEQGPVACGNFVGASFAFRKALKESRGRNLLALEMESFGFLRAALRANGAKTLVVKAISDLADEHKEELDLTTGDLLRAWAMSNALHLLSIGCRQIFSFDNWSDAKQSVKPGPGAGVVSGGPNALAEFSLRHFKKQHRRLVEDINRSLEIYDHLFRPILNSARWAHGNVFDILAAQIVASSNPFPLRINGRPGTGKTTFLSLLYLALLQHHRNNADAPVPVYVNLKRYISPERGKEREWVPRAAAEDDLAFLRKLLQADSQQSVIILLDGIDEYVRYDTVIEEEVLNLVEDCSQAKKVVSIGLNYLANREKFRRKLRRGLDNPETKITLEGVPLDASDRILPLISAFRVTYPKPIGDDPAGEIIRRAKGFRLQTLDLLLLSMLFDGLIDQIRYEQVRTLSDFFQIYCESFLQTESGNESLHAAAQLAFEYTVKPGFTSDLEAYVHRRSWKLIHLHATVRDFLVAWHAVQLVRSAANTTEAAQLTDLNYVYPHNVNRFCKDIVNSDRDVQFEVLEGARRIFREGGEHSRPHAAYLAGRVADAGAKEEAKAWLRKVCMPEVEKLQARDDEELSPGDLLLCRTVYISLAALNDGGASEDYIQLLLDRPAWNNINRGFHLEYYGDIPFDPERQLSHSDVLDAFASTYSSLKERIMQNLHNPRYGLLNVEVFTLYSLAQYRYVNVSRIPDGVRKDLVALADQLLLSRMLIETVREYLKMLQRTLSQDEPFSRGRIAQQLFGLKTEIRKGWEERQLDLKRVESVAEHTMGAFILGLTYLPDENHRKWRGYVKRDVLWYVLLHDLGEAIAGDASTRDPAGAQRAKDEERAAWRYLMMARTYPGIASFDQYYRTWEAFESQADENAKIARDLDKLENLAQLYLYAKQVKIDDYANWRDGLIQQVSTEAGKEILAVLQDYFEPDFERS